MFQKILIAARGEIVLRIARTCERLGIATVAIHSEPEAASAHVVTCDEAVCVGGAAPRDSYLNTAAIIAAAKQTGAEAIHPGCAALSQSAAFAKAVTEAGLVLIGPTAETLARFSSTADSRELARLAGVHALPFTPLGANGQVSVHELARELGYPLLVRASADDTISERVDDDHELTQAIGLCRDRASASCDDPRIHMEPYLDRPRLLAVQLMADARGECMALGELERCLERPLGSRVLLDESPAPALVGLTKGGLKRQIVCDAACQVAKEGGLVGAGMAEFLLDTDARLSFTRLRPGLPLEHGLAEMCAGLDMVEAQIRIAAGERLPPDVRRAQPSGNAIQARVWIVGRRDEAGPDNDEIKVLRWPTLAPGTLRVETDLTVGARAGTDHDPLVARVVAYGQTRHQALLTLDRVLAEATIEPLSTNIALLRQVLADESYRAGQYDAEFVERLSSEIRDYT
jgi:acetyl-CoA carboxylase biotin carboxylase subunit/3-methylcrotonyl-CoA carboxylase alpha subunit